MISRPLRSSVIGHPASQPKKTMVLASLRIIIINFKNPKLIRESHGFKSVEFHQKNDINRTYPQIFN
ncbi:MAG: hypothetical protein ACI9ZX_000694 [Algoriphagus sp.]|jgi:hypothetical protein